MDSRMYVAVQVLEVRCMRVFGGGVARTAPCSEKVATGGITSVWVRAAAIKVETSRIRLLVVSWPVSTSFCFFYHVFCFS